MKSRFPEFVLIKYVLNNPGICWAIEGKTSRISLESEMEIQFFSYIFHQCLCVKLSFLTKFGSTHFINRHDENKMMKAQVNLSCVQRSCCFQVCSYWRQFYTLRLHIHEHMWSNIVKEWIFRVLEINYKFFFKVWRWERTVLQIHWAVQKCNVWGGPIKEGKARPGMCFGWNTKEKSWTWIRTSRVRFS